MRLWPAAFIVGLLALVGLGLAGLDQPMLAAARSTAPWWPWITAVGDTDVRIGVTLVAAALLWRLRGGLEAGLMVATGIVGAVLSWGLKAGVGRPRPPDGLVEVFSASFPSGHALGSVATYVTVAVLAAPGDRRALVAAASLAALVGWSRMALGVHYLSDVAMGWLLGSLLVMAAVGLRSRIRRARDAAPRPEAPPPGLDPPGGP